MRGTFSATVILVAVGVSACGGGSGGGGLPLMPSTPGTVTTHSVTLSWQANRERGVNSAGGGYEVSISGQPTVIVPYVSGPAAPTSTIVSLSTGRYTVTVRAFAALDAQGGSGGSFSAPSQALGVIVP